MAPYLSRINFNWKSALTVSLVNIPLSISLAIAANATPVMGIVTAIWAGLLAGLLGGSEFNIVGPTGALSGILAMYAITYGIQALPLLAIMTGVLCLISWALKLDRYIVFIPSSVIHGFTLGVAFIIALNQTNFALNLRGLPQHAHFIENVIESFSHIAQADIWTFSIFAASLVFLFLWLRFIPKVPAPIVTAAIGIGLGYLSSIGRLGITLQTLYTKYGGIQAKLFAIQGFSPKLLLNPDLIKASMAIALIGILETLISAKLADAMTKTKFNQRREVFGLGIANIASGIFGGIPATAALARTALNVKSGAKGRYSAILNAAFVAAISLLVFPAFRYLPLSFVASILVFVAIRMVEREHFIKIFRHDKVAFCVILVVAAITIVEDPIVGILVGAVVSLLIFVNQLSKGQCEMNLNKNKQLIARINGQKLDEVEKHGADLVVYRLSGQMTYINAQSHLETLSRMPQNVKTVVLSLRNLCYIDVDGVEIMAEIIEALKAKNIQVYITGVGDLLMPFIGKTHWFGDLREQMFVFESTSIALERLGYAIAVPTR